jgi:MFS family permease
MTGPIANILPARRWCAFGGASLVFFFLNAATFTSLGVVLFTMAADLHWSMTDAGLSFTALGLSCGLSSPLAAVAMTRLGGRGSLGVGACLLAIGFGIASVSQTLAVFFVAMLFLGVGFTLSGNVPGVYLLAGWFRRGAAAIIGYYLMLGALGAAFGPPVVEAIVRHYGWRIHWRIMAVAAAAIAATCLLIVRDARLSPEKPFDPAQAGVQAGWTNRQAILTPQFMLVCGAMILTMCCVTTNSSVLVAHLVRLGTSPQAAAFVLSAGAATATLVKGGSGRLCQLVSPTILLGAGLVFQAVGCTLLAMASTPLLQYGSALTFGIGWGLSFVSSHIVPLHYFGSITGSKTLAVMALLTTFAAAGPIAAGMIADRTGSFAPIYDVYAVLLLVLAVPVVMMRAPRRGAALPVAAE